MDTTQTLTLLLATLSLLFFFSRGYYVFCSHSGPLQAKPDKRFNPIVGTFRCWVSQPTFKIHGNRIGQQ